VETAQMTDVIPTEQHLAIGDLCEIVESPRIVLREYIGMQCTLIEFISPDEYGQDCKIRVGMQVIRAGLCVLRKVRPPREDLKVTKWDECPWQPESLHVH
jgi:hypothetical protein